MSTDRKSFNPFSTVDGTSEILKRLINEPSDAKAFVLYLTRLFNFEGFRRDYMHNLDREYTDLSELGSPEFELMCAALKKALCSQIERQIAEIDEHIITGLNAVIHHPKFQALESRWRGLWTLVLTADSHRNIKVRVLDISKRECLRDLERAIEFDQSQIFNKVYNEAYGIAGGEPFGLIITDFFVQHKPSRTNDFRSDDISLLRSLAEVGAAAFTPIVLNADPLLFGLDTHAELTPLLNIHALFEQAEYLPFQSLRTSLDTRFIVLTLPRILMRDRYRTRRTSFRGVFFEERCTQNDDYLWGGSSFALGVIALREFASAGWFGHIRGAPQDTLAGGLVSHLVSERFEIDDILHLERPVTELSLTDSLERKLSAEGLMPLMACKDLPYAIFYNNSTLWNPRTASRKASYDDATLSGMLQHVLCASRVAHYVKVIIRDKIGSFASADECERALSEWIYQYTTGNEDLGWEEQARYPLKKAEVQVRELPSNPGQYACVMRLMPHYQADEMRAELELVTELVQIS